MLHSMCKIDSPLQMMGFIEAEKEETRNQKGRDSYIIILGL